MSSNKSLAKRIKMLRDKQDLSQQDVADEIGVSRATYSDMERANRDITAPEAKKLSEIFDISVDNLLDSVWIESKPAPIITKQFQFEEKKLKNVLLYILETCGGKPNLGETVLYKLLYFIDFDHYEQYGKPVTGLTYIHQQFGPVPLQTQYSVVIEIMKRRNELKIFLQEYFGKKQKRYVALKNHELGVLSEKEKQSALSVLNRCSDMGATEITHYVHCDIPWKITKNGDVIPYQLVFDREFPFAKHHYIANLASASAEDILTELGDIDEKEHDYYTNL